MIKKEQTRRKIKMDIKEKLKAVGLDIAEEVIIEILIPYLDELVEDTETKIDDAIMERLRPVLLDFVDRLDGEEG